MANKQGINDSTRERKQNQITAQMFPLNVNVPTSEVRVRAHSFESASIPWDIGALGSGSDHLGLSGSTWTSHLFFLYVFQTGTRGWEEWSMLSRFPEDPDVCISATPMEKYCSVCRRKAQSTPYRDKRHSVCSQSREALHSYFSWRSRGWANYGVIWPFH